MFKRIARVLSPLGFWLLALAFAALLYFGTVFAFIFAAHLQGGIR